MRKKSLALSALLFLAFSVNGQFQVKLPMKPGKENFGVKTPFNENRQMVMDDGFTFFDAEPVKGRNAKNTGDIDVGWYLKPSLRLIGTFPDNSGFRVEIKKSGKIVANFACISWIYKKENDIELKIKKKTGDFADYMQVRSCSNEKDAVKEIGQMD